MTTESAPAGGTVLAPSLVEPELDGSHERMTHIVLEGFQPKEGDYVAVGPSVVEGIVKAIRN